MIQPSFPLRTGGGVSGSRTSVPPSSSLRKGIPPGGAPPTSPRASRTLPRPPSVREGRNPEGRPEPCGKGEPAGPTPLPPGESAGPSARPPRSSPHRRHSCEGGNPEGRGCGNRRASHRRSRLRGNPVGARRGASPLSYFPHPPSSYRRKPVSRGAPGGGTPPPTHIAGALRDSVRPEPVEGFPPPPAAPARPAHPNRRSRTTPSVIPAKAGIQRGRGGVVRPKGNRRAWG